MQLTYRCGSCGQIPDWAGGEADTPGLGLGSAFTRQAQILYVIVMCARVWEILACEGGEYLVQNVQTLPDPHAIIFYLQENDALPSTMPTRSSH